MAAITVARDEEFALVTLNRPEVMNALSVEMMAEIAAALDLLEVKDPPRAVLFAGAGERAFCAGADIGGVGQRSIAAQLARVDAAQKVMSRIAGSRLPTIALIHGHALGGGLELALACTFRIATPEARMSLPEIRLGLVPSFGGTQRLPRLIGESVALEMIMTGRSVTGEEARALGLVSRLVPRADLLSEAKTFARGFSGHSLPVLELVRRAVQRGRGLDLVQGLAIEAECSALAHQTQDAREGVAAFREKRRPDFRDR